jgi:DNA-binding NarL/FixJ family response regulator
VASGVRYVEPIIAELMIFKRDDITKEVPHDKLSERELQILKMFAEGKTGNEIATTLAISKKTVSTHKVRLMQKMNFQNIAELVLYAANYALVE